MVVCHSPFFAQANEKRKGVKIVKIKKKATMNDHARRQEAKFWEASGSHLQMSILTFEDVTP